MSQQQTPYYQSDLDQQIGSLLEAWTCRDTGEHCRFCADVRVGDVPPDEQFCSEECENRFELVAEARAAIGKRDMAIRGYD